MPEIPEWLTKPGIKFSKEDVNNAMKIYIVSSSNSPNLKYYYVNEPSGLQWLFCIENGETRRYKFLWDKNRKLFDEDTFIRIGEHPELLAIM